MFQGTSLFFLSLLFIGAAMVVYIASIYVSNTTDVLSVRWGLGQALSGLILLAIVTNLPELVREFRDVFHRLVYGIPIHIEPMTQTTIDTSPLTIRRVLNC
jgi:hypothetical protein